MKSGLILVSILAIVSSACGKLNAANDSSTKYAFGSSQEVLKKNKGKVFTGINQQTNKPCIFRVNDDLSVSYDYDISDGASSLDVNSPIRGFSREWFSNSLTSSPDAGGSFLTQLAGGNVGSTKLRFNDQLELTALEDFIGKENISDSCVVSSVSPK